MMTGKVPTDSGTPAPVGRGGDRKGPKADELPRAAHFLLPFWGHSPNNRIAS